MIEETKKDASAERISTSFLSLVILFVVVSSLRQEFAQLESLVHMKVSNRIVCSKKFVAGKSLQKKRKSLLVFSSISSSSSVIREKSRFQMRK